MRVSLIATIVLGLICSVLGAKQTVDVNLTPDLVTSCFACNLTDTYPTDAVAWNTLTTDASGNKVLLGQVLMPDSSNDSISYSDTICCRYTFETNELVTIEKGTLQALNLTFNRWALYNNDGKPYGVLDYAYSFGIYSTDQYNNLLISSTWTLPDEKLSTAPRLGSTSADYYLGNFNTSQDPANSDLSSTSYMIIAYQVINTGQSAKVSLSNVTVTLVFDVPTDNSLPIGFGVGFGLGVPCIFLGIFLPVYFRVVKPKMKRKMEAKAMEMAKNSQNVSANTKYGAISGTSSTTSTGSYGLLGGNYSPLGPTSPEASVSSGAKPASKDLNERFNIPYREITFKSEIGAGGFGKVFMGEWQSTEVAIKVSNNTSSNIEFKKEAELMVNVRPHPNVLQVLGVSTDGIAPAIIMEYCPGGSLDLLLFDKSKPVTAEYQFRLILGIARGMLHLHKNNIVHRDLAARNILLSRDGEPKISDFGMSRIIESSIKEGTTRTNVGPIRWMAPESIKHKVYSTKSDMWSFGVVISEILNREEPHKEIEDVIEVAIAIRNELKTPKIDPDAPELLKEIMKQCWAINPDERPEMDAICDKLIKYKDQNNM